MKRIGLYGGTFDPVHNAHLGLAYAALGSLGLDELRWIPAGQPWQKSRQLCDAGHRAQMVRLAIAGEPRFTLECCEIERSGPSYTLQTVQHLQAVAQSAPGSDPQTEWFLLLGQDQYANFPTWHGWRELIARTTLAVAARDGMRPTPPESLHGVSHRMVVIPMTEIPISSTQIRAHLAAGLSATALVPDELPAKVASYIDQHRLYGRIDAPDAP